MTDEEFETAVEELIHFLQIFHRIKDKSERRLYRSFIRELVTKLTIV